ncbi:MAG: hypothetical protein WCO68_11020 [Verrucomicrobiota bacterium]
MSVIMGCALQGMTMPEGIFYIILGVFLLLKTDWVVKKILKIEDTNPDA